MERNYTKIWWQHCLAIIGFSVIPLFIVSISLYLLFDKIYTEKVLENLQNRVEARRDTVDLFLSERIAQIYTVAHTNTIEDLSDENYLGQLFSIMHAKSDSYVDIGVIDRNGDHLAYVGPYHDVLKSANYKNEQWFDSVISQGIFISDIFMGYRNFPHFIIAVFVRNGNNPWILRLTINLKNLDDIIQKAWIGKFSDSFIINQSNLLQTVPRFGGEYLSQPIFINKSEKQNSLSVPYPNLGSTVKTTVERIHLEGHDIFLGATPVRNTKWVFIIGCSAEFVGSLGGRQVAKPMIQGYF